MDYENKDRIDISVIMPALNEEKNIISAITNALASFKDFNVAGEVIVINDGSLDGTGDLVQELMKKDNRVRMIKHKIPEGVGASFWDGVDNASGDIVVALPGDNENEPGEIFRYLKLLEDVDMVVPFVYNKRARTLFRNILTFVLMAILNATFRVYFKYTSGTVLFRKSILDDMDYRCRSFFLGTDILVRLAKRGYLYAEVPYRIGTRNTGKSKAVTLSNSLQVIREYFRLAKDMYFAKKERLKRYKFSRDSVSLKRYSRSCD